MLSTRSHIHRNDHLVTVALGHRRCYLGRQEEEQEREEEGAEGDRHGADAHCTKLLCAELAHERYQERKIESVFPLRVAQDDLTARYRPHDWLEEHGRQGRHGD